MHLLDAHPQRSRSHREGREGREREGRTSAHPSRLAAHTPPSSESSNAVVISAASEGRVPLRYVVPGSRPDTGESHLGAI
jgi:hypothetical protein